MSSAHFKGLSLHLPHWLLGNTTSSSFMLKKWWLKFKLLDLSLKIAYIGGKTTKMWLLSPSISSSSHSENASLFHFPTLPTLTWDSHVQASLLHGTTGTDNLSPLSAKMAMAHELPFSKRTCWKVAQRLDNQNVESTILLKIEWKKWWRGIYIYIYIYKYIMVLIYWGITFVSFLFFMETNSGRTSLHHQLLHATMLLYFFMAPFSTYQHTKHPPSGVTR